MPTKILFIIPQLTVGGAEKILCQVVTSMDRTKFTPVVWNMGKPGKFSQPIRDAGVQLIEQKPLASRKFLYLDAWKLPAFIYREQIRIVHSFIFGPHWVDAILAKLVPDILYLVARLEVQLWRGGNLRLSWKERLRNRLVSHVVANSQAVKDVITDIEGFPDQMVSVIYNGVDLSEFAPYVGTDKTRTGSRRFCIGNVATLKEIKSQLTILQALDVLVNERNLKDLEVVFTGRSDEGYEEQVLHEFAAEKGLVPYIRSLGEIPNIYEELAKFDVMVLSSLAEGFSVAIVEALASGVPTVATRVGGNPEIVIPGETGELFEVGDFNRLADILQELYTQEKFTRQLGEGARKLVEERFLLPMMIEGYEKLYQSLLDRR